MGDIINYSLREFYEQDAKTVQEYIALLSFLEPVETARELFYMKLKDVQQVKDLMQNGTLDDLRQIVQLVQKLKKEEMFNMKIVEFFSLSASIKKQIQTIDRAEASSLTGKSYNSKWEMVKGGERMAKFGIYNTLDKLSQGKLWKYNAILDMVYADVFTKLLMDTVSADLDYEMSQIKTLKP